MRKKKVIKGHSIKPDKKFASPLVSKLINKVMRHGEKRTATWIVYETAEIVEKWFKEQQEKQKKEEKIASKVAETEKEEKKLSSETKQVGLADQKTETSPEKELVKVYSSPFLNVLERALENVRPGVEMKRKGIYRIPQPIGEARSLKIALSWLVECSKTGKFATKRMFEKLAEVIISAYNKTGEVIKKKENLYKEAEAGRIFSFSPSR